MHEVPELQVIDLGDAKASTRGWLFGPLFDDSPELTMRREDAQ